MSTATARYRLTVTGGAYRLLTAGMRGQPGEAASVAGSPTQVQFNAGAGFGASSKLTFDSTTGALAATSAATTGGVTAGGSAVRLGVEAGQATAYVDGSKAASGYAFFAVDRGASTKSAGLSTLTAGSAGWFAGQMEDSTAWDFFSFAGAAKVASLSPGGLLSVGANGVARVGLESTQAVCHLDGTKAAGGYATFTADRGASTRSAGLVTATAGSVAAGWFAGQLEDDSEWSFYSFAAGAKVASVSPTRFLVGNRQGVAVQSVTLSADQPAWALAVAASVVRVAASAGDVTVHGLLGSKGVSNSDTTTFVLVNAGPDDLTLAHESGSATNAADRFVCPGAVDLVLAADGFCTLVYDWTSSRWRVFA